MINKSLIPLTKYSTTQETAVGTWIDGKTIYVKVYDFGALPDKTLKSIPLNISGLDKILKVSGITISRNNEYYFPLPFIATQDEYNITLSITENNIIVRTAWDRTDFTQTYIYVYYTKQ